MPTSDADASGGGRLPRVSLRMRITLWVVLIFTMIQTTTQGVFVLHQRATVQRQFEQELETGAVRAADELAEQLPDVSVGGLSHVIAQALDLSRYESTAIDVFSTSGRSVVPGNNSGISWSDLGLIDIPREGSPVHVRFRPSSSVAQGPYRFSNAVAIGLTSPQNERFAVVVASSDSAVRAQMSLITRLALVSSLIAIFGAAVSARLIAGMAVEPLERLRSVAANLGPESIGERVEIDSANTEVARLSEELDKARIRIQDNLIAKERFLSNVSHEIKTPIAVLLIEAQTVDRRGCTPDVARFLDTVEEEMTRLGKLVESFLTLTRIQSGRGPATLKRYCLNDLVTDSIASCTLMAEQHQVTLRPTLLSDEETVDAATIGDPDLLRTLVENLVRNSIRFSSPGAVVDIVAEVTGRTGGVRVQDEGVGIPPERLKTIFDRFAQAHNAERQGRGHGLGLAIAKGIAELHGGTIEAFNRPDKGCEFVVQLKLAPAAHTANTRTE